MCCETKQSIAISLLFHIHLILCIQAYVCVLCVLAKMYVRVRFYVLTATER